MKPLKRLATIGDLQKYVIEMEKERKFNSQSISDKCIMIVEEVGELFKAIRREQGIKIDKKSKFGSIEEELADILIFLVTIANRYHIDLENAFRAKELKNEKRVWTKE